MKFVHSQVTWRIKPSLCSSTDFKNAVIEIGKRDVLKKSLITLNHNTLLLFVHKNLL